MSTSYNLSKNDNFYFMRVGQPGLSAFANVFSYCGAEDNCTVAAADGRFNQTFHECKCAIQRGLTDEKLPVQIAYMSLPLMNDTRTNIASGERLMLC